jgi:hypothetical protein
VQNAINAAQLLMSQGDGPLHQGAMNPLSLRKGHTVAFKGRDHKASELWNVLADYNSGKYQGGPRSCPRDHQKGQKYKNGKKYNNGWKLYSRYRA